MPNYNFRDVETGTVWTDSMTMSELEQYLKDNDGKVEQVFLSALPIVDPVRLGLRKPDSGFRDVLKNIKSHHPRGGGINTF